MKMTTAITCVLALCASSTVAIAADLPSRKEPPVYDAARPFSWTGTYLGIIVGYGWGLDDAHLHLAAPFSVTGLQNTNLPSGIIAGIQSGYSYQFPNNFVLGYASDLQFSDVRTSPQGGFLPFGYPATSIATRVSYFDTEKLRLGYAMDRFLPYVTGGLAVGRVIASPPSGVGGGLFLGTRSATRLGWAVGAGLEYALTDNLSVKAEYLYVELEGLHGAAVSFSPLPAAGPALGVFSSGHYGMHVARAGLNWKFNGLLSRWGLPEILPGL
jgi:outer membrane immunogenic protein